MSTPSLCFVLPFFDEKKKLAWVRKKKFPQYFDYFLESYSHNAKFPLIVFTNVPCKVYEKRYKGGPITFKQMSFKASFELFKRKLGITGYDYEQYRAYKLCDFKPTYGLVFDTYLKDFEYWGHIDPDAIIGDLSKFITSENIEGYEVISGSSSCLAGYLTIYRNVEHVNSLYTKSPDHLQVLNSPENFSFDEEGGIRDITAMQQLLRSLGVEIKLLGCVQNDFGTTNNDREWVYDWQDGKLRDRLADREIAMLHLMKSKKDPDFTFQEFRPSEGFSISRSGLFYS